MNIYVNEFMVCLLQFRLQAMQETRVRMNDVMVIDIMSEVLQFYLTLRPLVCHVQQDV